MKFSTGTLSSTLLDPFRNFNIKFSLSNSNRVQISFTLPCTSTREAFSLPSLQMASPPALLTTAVWSYHPPKKEFFLTLPTSRAYLSIFSLRAIPFLPRWGYTALRPMICSLRAITLAKRKQYMSRKFTSFIFLWLAAKKTSSLPTVSFTLQQPVCVGSKIILALLISQSGSVRLPKASEFSLNSRVCSVQILLPLLERVSTSYRSRVDYFLSFRRTVASMALDGSFWSLFYPRSPRLGVRSSETKPKPVSSCLNAACLGETSILGGTCCCWTRGWVGISSSEDELLPNSSFLFLTAYCRRAMRYILYFSRSALKRLSGGGGGGEPPDESVFSPAITKFSLMRTGCLRVSGTSSSDDEERPNSRRRCCCASRWRALRSARYSARSFLKSLLAVAGGACRSAEKRLRFQAIRADLTEQYNELNPSIPPQHSSIPTNIPPL